LLDIIIVTYNNEDTIRQCLDSISNQTIPCKINVKIFDNNSNDNTVEILKKYIPPKLNFSFQYFKNINNIGFGKACNYYAKQSTAEVILFMNPDLEIASDLLAEFYMLLTQHKHRITALGATHIDYNGNIRTQGVVGSAINHRDRSTMTYIEKGTHAKCLYISGGFFMVRNETLKAVDYFSEEFYLYYEDADLGLKLHKHFKDECNILNMDFHRVKHKFQGSNIDREKRMEYIRQSKAIFEEKWKEFTLHV
jgi:GT2 family glycosyltransferase